MHYVVANVKFFVAGILFYCSSSFNNFTLHMKFWHISCKFKNNWDCCGAQQGPTCLKVLGMLFIILQNRKKPFKEGQEIEIKD